MSSERASSATHALCSPSGSTYKLILQSRALRNCTEFELGTRNALQNQLLPAKFTKTFLLRRLRHDRVKRLHRRTAGRAHRYCQLCDDLIVLHDHGILSETVRTLPQCFGDASEVFCGGAGRQVQKIGWNRVAERSGLSFAEHGRANNQKHCKHAQPAVHMLPNKECLVPLSVDPQPKAIGDSWFRKVVPGGVSRAMIT